MRFSKDDVANVIADLVAIRMKLDMWGNDLASHSAGRLSPYESLIVSAEANTYRSLVQLKEAYRNWTSLDAAAERNERNALIAESPVLVTSDMKMEDMPTYTPPRKTKARER